MANNIVEEDFEDFDIDEVVDEDEAVQPDSKMTTTDNFMGGEPEIVDEIQDLGLEIVEKDESRTIRVRDDVGPIYYGSDLIELKKGRRYKVPPHILSYLEDRNLLAEVS